MEASTPTRFQSGPGADLASWWSRVGAALIDNVIAYLVAGLLFGLAAGAQALGAPQAVFGPLAVLGLSALFLYLPVSTALLNGQSLGKRSVRIRIVRNDGKPVSWGLSFLRELLLKQIVFILPLFLIDSLWAAFDKERRSLHDLIVRTHVVTVQPVPRDS